MLQFNQLGVSVYLRLCKDNGWFIDTFELLRELVFDGGSEAILGSAAHHLTSKELAAAGIDFSNILD